MNIREMAEQREADHLVPTLPGAEKFQKGPEEQPPISARFIRDRRPISSFKRPSGGSSTRPRSSFFESTITDEC